MNLTDLAKKLLSTPAVLAGALLLGSPALAGEAGEAAPARSDWSFDVVPYLWLATYEGEMDLPGGSAGAGSRSTETEGAYSTSISAGAMLAAQVHYRNFGLLLDGAWLQLETEGQALTSLYSGTDIQTDIAYGTAALSYQLPQVGDLHTEVFAGTRVWYTSNEIGFRPGALPGFTADGSRSWVDPLIGARLRYDFTRRCYAIVLGDVGGFGVGSDQTWSAYGGVGYRFADWISMTLGYRYMHLDFQDGGFVSKLNVQGFLLGVGFHF